MKTAAFLIFMSLALCGVCQAQDDRRLSVALHIGTTSGAAAHDLEDAMRTQGFGDTASIWATVRHPFSNTGISEIGYPKSLAIHYRLRPRWSIGGIVSSSPVGATFGYHDPFQFISIDQAVTSYGATASLSHRIFRIGIGPAVHIAKAREAGPWETHAKLGFIADGGLRIPSTARFFFDVDLQYRYVGRVTLRPYTAPSLVGSGLTFNPSNVAFNHWFIGLGPGMRF